MAERIADPVNRLTRATRRIARGDLDARIAATSSDELRRLVEDFNRMAGGPEAPARPSSSGRSALEAWADMARQVAHDIKNPLTPIQLSAEHARRVNVDRGRPLSPVTRRVRRRDPHAGPAAAADRRRVLQLRLVADAAARADAARRRCSTKSSTPYRAGLRRPRRDRRQRATRICRSVYDRPHAVRARA